MMKVVCTVWSGGKTEDNFKSLPITIGYTDKKEPKTSFLLFFN